MIRFDTTYEFEELPLVIGNSEYAYFTGSAALEESVTGGFYVTGIELEGSLKGSYRDKRHVQLRLNHDDIFLSFLFMRLAEALEKSDHANAKFNEEREEARWAGAA